MEMEERKKREGEEDEGRKVTRSDRRGRRGDGEMEKRMSRERVMLRIHRVDLAHDPWPQRVDVHV